MGMSGFPKSSEVQVLRTLRLHRQCRHSATGGALYAALCEAQRAMLHCQGTLTMAAPSWSGRQSRPDYEVRARGGALRVMLKGIVAPCCVSDLGDLLRFMMRRRRPMAAHLDVAHCQTSYNLVSTWLTGRQSRSGYLLNLRQRRDSPHVEPALPWVSRLRFVICGARQQHGSPVCLVIFARGAISMAQSDNT